ncbi:hypothetical protein FKM82_001925 [Ascaphus truei]
MLNPCGVWVIPPPPRSLPTGYLSRSTRHANKERTDGRGGQTGGPRTDWGPRAARGHPSHPQGPATRCKAMLLRPLWHSRRERKWCCMSCSKPCCRRRGQKHLQNECITLCVFVSTHQSNTGMGATIKVAHKYCVYI